MERIGTYTIERKLGEGGMGTVYLGRSRGGRAVALKVVRPELASDPTFRERFRVEIEAVRKVGGFHTAPVVDADPHAEAPWFATAYVPGPTLSGFLAANGPMDENGLRRLGAALAEALQAVHNCGLVHRDLKPGNIIMAADGPRVLDFGIVRTVENARLTVAGTAFGTPGFLAPEQAEGRAVTGAADVFALGAVLVAAAGGSAFGEGTPVMLMYRSVHHGADVSAVPENLRPVVVACLEKAPERRPSTGQLLDWLTYSPGAHAPGTPAPGAYAPTALAVPPLPSHSPPHPALAAALPTQSALPSDAPEFLAMDRRNDVVADFQGISFSRNGTCVDFPWSEIHFAGYTRDARGLTVTVTMNNATSYACRVTSRRRGELDLWATQLDAVLGRFLRRP